MTRSGSREESGEPQNDDAAGPAVAVRALTRRFEGRRGKAERMALDGFDLTVHRGQVHGLLGPNGAGKTTLCKILATVLLPSSGTATVSGFDVVRDAKAVRSRIGIVFGGERGLYGRLTVRQNLRFWAALYRQSGPAAKARVEYLLERVGLTEWADEPVETFSRGMKQRLHLARGLVGDPEVIVLDEPTIGMDPVAARDFRALVEELRAEDRSILLTTHDMVEAEVLCDEVSLIDGGRLLTREDPRTIGRWLSRYERVEAEDAPAAVMDEVAKVPGVSAVERPQPGLVIIETDAEGAAALVLRLLVEAGVTSVRTSRPSLEDVYLHLIGDRGLAVH